MADEAVDALAAFLTGDGTIDEFLADQLLLPLAFAPGCSVLRTAKVTQHLLTNAEVIRQFVPVELEIHGSLGAPGLVRLATTVSFPPQLAVA